MVARTHTPARPFLVVASGRDDKLIREWTAERFKAQYNDPRKVATIECFPNNVELAMDAVEGQFLNKAETVVLRLFFAGHGALRVVHRYIKANTNWNVEWNTFEFDDEKNDSPLPDTKLCPNIFLCPTKRRSRNGRGNLW